MEEPLALIARRRRDGLSSHDLAELCMALYRVCMSQQRHQLADSTSAESSRNSPDSDLIDSAEASRLLNLSRRQTQRLAASGLDGVRVGSIWLYDRRTVTALADERKATR